MTQGDSRVPKEKELGVAQRAFLQAEQKDKSPGDVS